VTSLAISAAVAADSGFHRWLERWAPAAEWGVAIGTAALAVATLVLVRHARDEVAAVRQEATHLADQAVRSLRAYVYPESDVEWALGLNEEATYRHQWIPLRNGGPGLALNVRGEFVNGAGAPVSLYAGSIAPGRAEKARAATPVADGWAGARGELRYDDLNGEAWVTHFAISVGDNNALVVEHEPPEREPPK